MVIDYKNVKKYIVLFSKNSKTNHITYDIDEVQYITTELWIRTKYRVRNNVNILNINTMERSWIGEGNLGRNSLFTSDSFQECLDELNLILESEKYNL